jgi:tRNA (guanine37-N1)-methyltransferase
MAYRSEASVIAAAANGAPATKAAAHASAEPPHISALAAALAAPVLPESALDRASFDRDIPLVVLRVDARETQRAIRSLHGLLVELPKVKVVVKPEAAEAAGAADSGERLLLLHTTFRLAPGEVAQLEGGPTLDAAGVTHAEGAAAARVLAVIGELDGGGAATSTTSSGSGGASAAAAPRPARPARLVR